MKKILILITCVICTFLNMVNSEAKIILRDFDSWEIQEFPDIIYYGGEIFIQPGYYLFPLDSKNVLEYNTTNTFHSQNIKDNYYIPFFHELDDNISLFFVEEDELFMDTQINNFEAMIYNTKNLIENIIVDNTLYEFYYFYSPVEPIDSPPFFEGDTEIKVRLSQNLSLGSIISNIKAFDYRDGDLTRNIKIESDNYTSNKNTPGTYEVTLSVQDYYNNETKLIIHITVIYDLYSSITGIDTIIVTTNYNLDISSIKQLITATDYKGLELPILIEKDEYSENKNTPGIYEIIFSAVDKNNLKVEHLVTVNVIKSDVDFYSPIYNQVFIEQNKNYSNDQLINILKMVDNIPQHFEIRIESNIEPNNKGKYDVFYEIYNFDNEIISNKRITFIFLESTNQNINNQKKSINFTPFIIIGVVTTTIITVSIIFIKKRKVN